MIYIESICFKSFKIFADQHFPSSSQSPDFCPRTLHPPEQAQSPKKHLNPALNCVKTKTKEIV
jgi:hypothetical protein